MTQFRVTRPNNEARLRQWPPGRVSQLKLMLSHLEGAVNNALAAQVIQSGSRTFSEFVPKIVTQDITVELNYREIRLIFNPPRGLRKFLFYELQVSRNPVFNSFISFNSPEPAFTFTAIEPGVTFYFRLRVVTTDGEVGPWSETVVQTALRARASSLFDNRTIKKVLPINSSNVVTDTEYQTLLEATHSSIGGTIFYMVTYDIQCFGGPSSTHNLSWTDLEFRWLEDGEQVGGTFDTTVYKVQQYQPSLLSQNIEGTVTEGNSFVLPGPYTTRRTGTFSQKLHNISEGTVTIQLQARQKSQNLHPGTQDWTANLDSNETAVKFQRGALIQLRNFSSFEYVLDS